MFRCHRRRCVLSLPGEHHQQGLMNRKIFYSQTKRSVIPLINQQTLFNSLQAVFTSENSINAAYIHGKERAVRLLTEQLIEERRMPN